ncbi:MAG TPA: hypothetical protein VGG99_12875 [Acetobacteraceae bacterium]
MLIEVASDIGIEGREEPLDRRELIRRFPAADVAMVAFARFVVIAQHTLFLIDKRQPVLVAMFAARDATRYLPHNDLGERSRPQALATTDDQRLQRAVSVLSMKATSIWESNAHLAPPPGVGTSGLQPAARPLAAAG